jgi:hypothetical protein
MPQFGAHLILREEPDQYELVALVCCMPFPSHCGRIIDVLQDIPSHRIAAINSNVDGQNAFITGDLFKRHHSDPFLWKVWGRADDQIVLSNGEKVCGLFGIASVTDT